MTKGESLRDTLLTVSAMGTDAVIIRNSSEGPLFCIQSKSPKVKTPLILMQVMGRMSIPVRRYLNFYTS